jgi:hypothetical protein
MASSAIANFSEKTVLASRQNQHARRVRYPEMESPSQTNRSAKSFNRNTDFSLPAFARLMSEP